MAIAKKTTLPIDFVIVGASISGLACAIALRRVGHRVVVLDKDKSVHDEGKGGCRLPPNLSKILFHWGLEKELRAIAVKSTSLSLRLWGSGEILGNHVWDEEVLKETQGEFIFTHHGNFRRLLCNAAVAHGAVVRFNAEVTSIDVRGAVTLRTGERLSAEVIVGADGPEGISRQSLLRAEGGEDRIEISPFKMFSSIIPQAAIRQDPTIMALLGKDHETRLTNWLGHGQCVAVFPIGMQEYALYVHTANIDKNGDYWQSDGSLNELFNVVRSCDAGVQKLVRLAKQPRMSVLKRRPLEEWVSGRLVVIGEAAHPIVPGGVQATAMSMEDGAVFAKLFSHLRTRDQIESFLYAFQDVRQPRCNSIVQSEHGNIFFLTIPKGEHQEGRDQVLRAKRDAGLGVLEASADDEENPQWTEIKDIFGYDAEDAADDWWVEWGALRERAKGVEVSYGSAPLHVAETVSEH